ncbi:helix-turn-helix domain-containing protein [Algicola sagamiensis]|uniref:helix-turn-helix domain-containing protein n=1 Tax=Algicola sagamiensis TaxID=163869 RepID=UPI0003621EC3|nr:XRE family transcriptional regulator [Algicola sagamiensis]
MQLSLVETIGDRVRYYRERKKISQKELGEKAGVSQQTIQKLENGDITRTKVLPEIAEILSISEKYLREGKGSPNELSEVPKPEQSFDANKVADLALECFDEAVKSIRSVKIRRNDDPNVDAIKDSELIKHAMKACLVTRLGGDYLSVAIEMAYDEAKNS